MTCWSWTRRMREHVKVWWWSYCIVWNGPPPLSRRQGDSLHIFDNSYILTFSIMLIQGQLERQVGIVLNKSCTLKAARFFETAASNMPVALSSCPNCRPSQVKQCPQLNNWAECNKRVGSFKLHVGEFVDTPSLSWNLFFVWWRSCCLDARGCRVKLRILVSRNSILSLHELYEM